MSGSTAPGRGKEGVRQGIHRPAAGGFGTMSGGLWLPPGAFKGISELSDRPQPSRLGQDWKKMTSASDNPEDSSMCACETPVGVSWNHQGGL